MNLYGGLEKSQGQRDCTKGHAVPVCILGRNVWVAGVGGGDEMGNYVCENPVVPICEKKGAQ